MFVVANRFTVADGYGDQIIERFGNGLGNVSEHPGFVRFDFLEPADDGNVYVAQTYWESEADFEAWTETEDFRAAHSDHPPREMFDGHPTLEKYETAITRD